MAMQLICPWMGKQCHGPQTCAPAVFAAQEISEDSAPSCPIVASVSSLALISMAMLENASQSNVGDPTKKPSDFDRLLNIDQDE